MICLALIAIILMAGYSYAIQDRYIDKDYNLARNYGPGWVIPSVLDASGKVKMDESTQKLNDLEKNLSNNPNKENNSDPVLQKKRGAGGGTNKALPNNVGLQDVTGNILMGTGTDQRDINGSLISESGGKLYSEVINGTRMVYAGFDNDSQEQNAQVIQDAIDYFARHSFTDGGKVLVREGTYEGTVNLSGGVSLYGGYDDKGNRNIDFNSDRGATNINGGFSISNINSPTEINGFYINSKLSSQGIYITDSSNITIANNAFVWQYFNGDKGRGVYIANNSTNIFVKNNMFHSSDALKYVWNAPDSACNLYIELTGNRIEGTVMFCMDGLTANVENNVFDGGSMFVYPSTNSNKGATINSINNDYIGVYDLAPGVYGNIISTNDYFEFGEPIFSGAPNFTINPTSDSPNSDSYLQSYNPFDSPLYFSPGSGKDATATIQLFSGYSSLYYPQKIDYDSILIFDLFRNDGKLQNVNVVSNTFTFGGPVYIFNSKQFDASDISYMGNIDPDKITDSYVSTLQGKLYTPINDIATLQDTILTLETKDNKSDTEENLLEAAKLLAENSQYLDDETLKEFNQIARVVEMTEEMRNLMRPEDLNSISSSLEALVKEERRIYDNYLKSTNDIYEKLEALLGINATEEILPDTFIPLSNLNRISRRKVMIDLIIKRLGREDPSSITNNQKEALKIDREVLSPMRNAYLSELKMAIKSFVWDVQDVVSDKPPASASKDKDSFKALFLLQRVK